MCACIFIRVSGPIKIQEVYFNHATKIKKHIIFHNLKIRTPCCFFQQNFKKYGQVFIYLFTNFNCLETLSGENNSAFNNSSHIYATLFNIHRGFNRRLTHYLAKHRSSLPIQSTHHIWGTERYDGLDSSCCTNRFCLAC